MIPKKKNYKTELKEIKEISEQWFIPCSFTGRVNAIRMSILPKLKSIKQFSAIPTKSQQDHCHVCMKKRQADLKIYLEI